MAAVALAHLVAAPRARRPWGAALVTCVQLKVVFSTSPLKRVRLQRSSWPTRALPLTLASAWACGASAGVGLRIKSR